jgi:hypothetical protein
VPKIEPLFKESEESEK